MFPNSSIVVGREVLSRWSTLSDRTMYAGKASSSARRFLNSRRASKRASFSVLGSPKGSSLSGAGVLRFLPRLVSFASSRRITTNRAVALPKGHHFLQKLFSDDCCHCRQSQSSRVAAFVISNHASREREFHVLLRMFSVVDSLYPQLRRTYSPLKCQPKHLCRFVARCGQWRLGLFVQ